MDEVVIFLLLFGILIIGCIICHSNTQVSQIQVKPIYYNITLNATSKEDLEEIKYHLNNIENQLMVINHKIDTINTTVINIQKTTNYYFGCILTINAYLALEIILKAAFNISITAKIAEIIKLKILIPIRKKFLISKKKD